MKNKIYIKTFGCRLNISESESLASQLSKHFIITDESANPDAVVINTCTVTGEAEKKAIRFAQPYCSKGIPIFITGCFYEPESQLFRSPGVTWVPIEKKSMISQLIHEHFFGDDHTVFSEQIRSTEFSSFLPPASEKILHSRAFLKIQDGCDQSCTYCKVRFARGCARSLPAKDVIERVGMLAGKGFTEIILTGINIASYESDIAFSALLEELVDLFPQLWFQLTSLEINTLDDRFFKVLRHPSIKPCFHLPLQSGSDSILTAMNRPYTIAAYLTAVEKVMTARPDAFLSTDIIVGFPGESEQTIGETFRICERAGFHHLHLFPFSPRNGTAAYTMVETFSPQKKKEWMSILAHSATLRKERYYRSFIGVKEEFVLESWKDKLAVGKGYHNLEMSCSSSAGISNSAVKKENALFGKGTRHTALTIGVRNHETIGVIVA